MPIENEIVTQLAAGGYHPRSSKPSDHQSAVIIRDLVAQCPLIGQRARNGELVAKLRHHQQVGHADWVIDIAIGTPAGRPSTFELDLGLPIIMAPPVIIQIAIELKSIYTEHGKARKNRLRDFNSFHGYAHQYDPRTVAAAFLVVNAADRFYSPLRDDTDITTHSNSKATSRQIAANAVNIFRSIHLRTSANDVPGMEAVGVAVIEHDNLAFHPDPAYQAQSRATSVAPTPPNPPVGDPLHYESMIQRICNAYTTRFP
ncbi:hypothetical protein ACWGS9_23315 [Bradyrhizobium sp. Arg314]